MGKAAMALEVGDPVDMPVDPKKVRPVAQIRFDDPEEQRLFESMLSEATSYLESFRWCGKIVEAYSGIEIPGVLDVFLFRIEPSERHVDEWLWAIVGDLPPAYITTDQAPNPASALDGYIGAMEAWVQAVKQGQSTEGLIPVNAPPTLEYASLLEKRLNFLDEMVLAQLKDDLNAQPMT
jgi:hypothetical protein